MMKILKILKSQNKYSYVFLASFAVLICFLGEVFNVFQSVALFSVVALAELRYKFTDRCIKKITPASYFVSVFFSFFIIVLVQLFPFWYVVETQSETVLKVIFCSLEVISLGLFFHPVINFIISGTFDYKSFSIFRLLKAFIVTGAFYFTLYIYLPFESFINNIDDMNFRLGDFAWYEVCYLFCYTLFTSCLVSVFKDKQYKNFISGFVGIDLCAYIQYMFLNFRLHLLDGETMNWSEHIPFSAVTGLLWLFIVILFVILSKKLRDIYNKIELKIPAGLLLLQGMSVFIMMISVGGKLFEVRTEILSGENQYVVSSRENVIMFVLDATDNSYFMELLEKDEKAFDGYEDFTLYTNTCSVFDSTPTSMTQMITGMGFEVELSGEDWFRNAWNSERNEEFFNRFHEANYIVNGYYAVYGDQKYSKSKMDNFRIMSESEYYSQVTVMGKEIADEFLTLSLYRLLPFAVKRVVDYERINFNSHVETEDDAYYKNDDYEANMFLELSESDNNYLIIEHLDGTHPPCEDFTGESMHLLDIIGNYINQMKALGVYESSSIIITADHGQHNDSNPELAATPVFMIKKAKTSGSELTISDAPVYHEDIQATLLDCAGLYDKNKDEQMFGRSVFDISEDEIRERTWYDRRDDDEFKYVKMVKGAGFAWSGCNSYYGYTYSGNTSDLEKMVKADNPTSRYQMVDNKG